VTAGPLVAEPAAAQFTAVQLTAVADRIRRRVVDMCAGDEGGHLGGSLSLADILAALYFGVLRVDPDRPDWPGRDVLVLSKGHGALALYAALAERGFLDPAELDAYGQPGTRLLGHPVRSVPGVELPTGSLGHGLALGLGFAVAGRLAGLRRRTVVITGDGELQEGSCWEAAGCASALAADELVAIVDRNGLQLTAPTEELGPLEPLADRWRAFGWSVREVDGHDPAAVAAAVSAAPWAPGRPSALLAATQKGYGIPFIAGRPACHYVRMDERLHARARGALAAFLRRRSL
jgi:transketolase